MPATIEEFLRAFSGTVAAPAADGKKVEDVLKQLKEYVAALVKTGAKADRFQTALSDLTKRYSAATAATGNIDAELKRIYEAARGLVIELRLLLNEYVEYAKARKDALSKLEECMVVGRSYSALQGDRNTLQAQKWNMERIARGADFVTAQQRAVDLKTKSVEYLKQAAAEQQQYDRLGEQILKAIKDACYFKEDNVTRDWINKKLTPEQLKFLPTKVRNRMMAELHEGVFSGDDKDAMKKMYSVRTLDAEFEKAEKKKRDAYIELMKNDPEFKKARAEWSSMDKDQKMKLLEKAANYHADAYGTKVAKGAKPLKVKAYDKEPKKDKNGKVTGWNNGVYNHSSGTITVNTNSYSKIDFHDFDTALDLITHEAGHRYQHVLADKVKHGELKPGDPEYDQAVAFGLNDKYYVDEPAHVYENQPMETHSRLSGEAVAAANIGGAT